MSMRANVVELAEYHDPEDQKRVILEKVNAVKVPQVFASDVLVATYVRPNKSKGGIIFTDKNLDENRFQGKVGLVIAKGPTAFKYDGAYPWEGPVPEVGDWVIYRANDAWENFFNGISVRWIDSDLIKGSIEDPTLIY